MKAFINSQFGYCPMVWMCRSRKSNNRIYKIHERALRIVYKESNATFEELLTKDGAVTIHDRNIQMLAIEKYTVIKGDSPEIIREIFQLKERDIYHSNFLFKSQNVRTFSYVTQSLRHLGPKIWSLIPENVKRLTILIEFKRQMRRWKPRDCPCRLCKNYVYVVCFVD